MRSLSFVVLVVFAAPPSNTADWRSPTKASRTSGGAAARACLADSSVRSERGVAPR